MRKQELASEKLAGELIKRRFELSFKGSRLLCVPQLCSPVTLIVIFSITPVTYNNLLLRS